MTVIERFLKLVSFDTTSSEESGQHPSTPNQKVLGAELVRQMQELGIQDARMDTFGYVYGTIPANCEKSLPVYGLIAHMDTSPDAPGGPIHARITEVYEGGDIILNEEQGIVLSPREYESLLNHTGKRLIVTDSTTLLGADDKAGVAEILSAAELLLASNLPHGTVKIAFTPDEEIGEGADHFDVAGFGAEYAYTVDGGAIGELEYENFNAAGAKVKIKGFSVHPGSSKNTMINAALVAMEFNSMLPAGDTPANTEEYEGFFHLCEMSGDVSDASLDYIIRDHDSAMFACRQEMMRHIAKLLNEKYGEGTVTLTIKEQYRNMKEKIEPCMHLIDNAKKAVQESGLNPVTVAIRGGTDGARLSFMGLPCPNLGTGGYAFHGPCEHITIEGMDYAVENLKNIVKLYAL